MKKISKITLALLLIFAFANLNGQIKYGAKAGLNFSTMTLKYMGLSIDPKTLVGFHIGGYAEFPIIENLSIQPGLLISTKGTKYDFSSEKGTISPVYLDVPVNLMYSFNINPKIPKISVFTGPYFAYGIAGKYKIGDESSSISYGSGDDYDLKPFDMGINFGAGMTFNKIFVSLQYGIGFANLSPATSVDMEMKNRVFGISAAYQFGGK
jgi:hypothetical protein